MSLIFIIVLSLSFVYLKRYSNPLKLYLDFCENSFSYYFYLVLIEIIIFVHDWQDALSNDKSCKENSYSNWTVLFYIANFWLVLHYIILISLICNYLCQTGAIRELCQPLKPSIYGIGLILAYFFLILPFVLHIQSIIMIYYDNNSGSDCKEEM